VLIEKSNFKNEIIIHNRPKKKKKHSTNNWKKRKMHQLEYSLFYYQKSPNFCEKSEFSSGTYNRKCNRSSMVGSDSCNFLCCGRGK
jgi:hypothetical protein